MDGVKGRSLAGPRYKCMARTEPFTQCRLRSGNSSVSTGFTAQSKPVMKSCTRIPIPEIQETVRSSCALVF